LCNGFRTTRPESAAIGRTEKQPTPVFNDLPGSAAIGFDRRLPLNLRVGDSTPTPLIA
jgi:hypothetical protein